LHWWQGHAAGSLAHAQHSTLNLLFGLVLLRDVSTKPRMLAAALH
jgi:hypothetical protein